MAAAPGGERTVCVVTEFRKGDPAAGARAERRPRAALRAGEVRARMELAPINPSDVNVLEGTYLTLPKELPAPMGGEGAGVVTEVGEGVGALAVGDRVFGRWGGGTWCSECCAPAEGLRKVPEGVPAALAAVLSGNPPTAYMMLRSAGVPLAAGDWVLQNLASSGVGTAVVQVARAMGLRAVHVVRSEEAAERVRGLGAEHVVVFDEGDVDAPAREVKRATGGAPIALALNGVGGDSAKLLLKCLAPGGTLLTYGLMGRKPVEVGGGQLIFKDLRVLGFHMGRVKMTPAERDEMWRFLLDIAAKGELVAPPVSATYPLAQIKDAVAHSFGKPGKVMLSCAEDGTPP